MKKLMIAAAIVCAAVVSNAASIEWAQGYGLDAYGASGDSAMFEGTTYLMVGDSTVAASFIETVLAAGADYQSAFDSAVGSALQTYELTSAGGSKIFTSDAFEVKDVINAFVVAIDGSKDGIYISELANATVPDKGNALLNYDHDAAYAGTLFGSDVKTYQGAGWYTAAAVPEPTSGLLLLLGVAGLALRRRRA